MSKHWSIEVLDGPFSAETWYAAHADLSCGDVACMHETGAADVTAAFSAFPEGSDVVVDCGRTVSGQ